MLAHSKGSGPYRGKSPVEWGDFLSIRLFVCSPLWPEAWLDGPQTWLARPQAWLDSPEGGQMD